MTGVASPTLPQNMRLPISRWPCLNLCVTNSHTTMLFEENH